MSAPRSRNLPLLLTLSLVFKGRDSTTCCPSCIYFQVPGLGNREPGSGILVQVRVRVPNLAPEPDNPYPKPEAETCHPKHFSSDFKIRTRLGQCELGDGETAEGFIEPFRNFAPERGDLRSGSTFERDLDLDQIRLHDGEHLLE